MNRYRIKRKGRDDLVFRGELLARAHERNATPEHDFRLTLELYKTSVGSYILSSGLHFDNPLQNDIHGALAFDSPEDVVEFLMTEGKDLDNVIRNLVEKAAQSDKDFLPLLPVQPGSNQLHGPNKFVGKRAIPNPVSPLLRKSASETWNL